VTMRPCFSKRRDETQSTNWSSASWLTYLPRSPRWQPTVLEGQMALWRRAGRPNGGRAAHCA